MDAYAEISHWMFKAEVWVIVGIGLVMADIFLGYSFFILPVGIAAFLISAMIFSQQKMWLGNFTFFDTWRDIVIYFAVLALVSIAVLKFAFQKFRKSGSDINDY